MVPYFRRLGVARARAAHMSVLPAQTRFSVLKNQYFSLTLACECAPCVCCRLSSIRLGNVCPGLPRLRSCARPQPLLESQKKGARRRSTNRPRGPSRGLGAVGISQGANLEVPHTALGPWGPPQGRNSFLFRVRSQFDSERWVRPFSTATKYRSWNVLQQNMLEWLIFWQTGAGRTCNFQFFHHSRTPAVGTWGGYAGIRGETRGDTRGDAGIHRGATRGYAGRRGDTRSGRAGIRGDTRGYAGIRGDAS